MLALIILSLACALKDEHTNCISEDTCETDYFRKSLLENTTTVVASWGKKSNETRGPKPFDMVSGSWGKATMQSRRPEERQFERKLALAEKAAREAERKVQEATDRRKRYLIVPQRAGFAPINYC